MASYRIEGFKFDRANLKGIDADCIKGINAFLCSRETEINTITTRELVCDGGPFDGQTIELNEGEWSAEFCIRDWAGRYANDGKWQGSTGEAMAPVTSIDTRRARTTRGAKECELGKGFNALRQLFAELGEDPAERAFMRPKTKSVSVQYGYTDDFGARIEYAAPRGAYNVWLEQVPNLLSKSRKRSYLTIERVECNTSRDHGNAWAADDFGDLFRVPDSYSASSHNERAEYVITEAFARYSIGRTSYTIRATAEAVEALRQRLLRAKKWYADKLLSVARQAQSTEDAAADVAQLAAIDASIADKARQDVAQVLASAQAAAAIEQAQAVAVDQAEPASEAGELVTCEAGENEAQASSMGRVNYVSNKHLAPVQYAQAAIIAIAKQAFSGVFNSDSGGNDPALSAPASHTPGEGGVFRSILESEPEKSPPAYCLPTGRVHDGWAACKSADFTPDARQQMVMDAVSIALSEGLFYTKDVLARCVDLLSIDANTQAIKSERVEGGDVGMDVYYARDAVDAKAANLVSREIARALNLHVGDTLGTLVFSDYKRCTGVAITAVSKTGLSFTISGKRGTSTVSGDVGADNLKQSINRAHSKGLRKTDFEQFTQGRQPVKPENCAAAEVTATAATNQAPAAPAPANPASESCVWTNAHTAAQQQAQSNPTIKGKSGKWCAWLYKTISGLHGLVFLRYGHGVGDVSGYPTTAERMAALTALAKVADFVPPNPPEKPGWREGSFVQNSKPVSPVSLGAAPEHPHGLQVGDVVRSSWGYDQTNVNHYQIVKVIGKRTVEVRELAEHHEATGDMTGRVTPIPGDFVGEPMRRQVDRRGSVNMLHASYGRASKIEPLAVVHGVRCYPAAGYSSYA